MTLKEREDVQVLLKRLRGAGETYTYLHEAADLIESLSARVAELEQTIDSINVGLKDGEPVIWIMDKPGFYLSVREAIDAVIGKPERG